MIRVIRPRKRREENPGKTVNEKNKNGGEEEDNGSRPSYRGGLLS